MKAFWKEHSYNITKLFINQIGMAIFGLVLTTAAMTSNNESFPLYASIFSVLFYMALAYSMMWELGAKDKIKIESKRLAYNKFTGAKIALWASVPNIILVVILNIRFILAGTENGPGLEWAGNIYVITNGILRFLTSFYTGINVSLLPSTGNGYMINSIINPLFYIAAVFPVIIVSTAAYILGTKDISLFSKRKNKK